MQEKKYFEKLSVQLQEKYRTGIRELDRGKFEQATEIFTELKEEVPDFVPLYNKLAVIAIYQKELDKAQQYLLTSLELDEQFVPSLTNLGSLARENGELDKAKEYYTQAMEIDPEYGPAYNNMGVILRQEGNIKDSIKYLKQSHRLAGKNSDELSNNNFFREPGCYIPLIIFVVVIIAIYLFLR
ncbi:MAG: tetratricopeptide repeat protein [Halanaerobiales bacterium]|nr:tetratricopeptide repeat protein [Halanaerobiales bacterium]